MKRWLFYILVVSCGVLILLCIAAAKFGRGGRGLFSPDTLETRGQYEWVIPYAGVTVYRGTPSPPEQLPLVKYLITHGYWAKSVAPVPRLLITFRWNQQWRGWYTTFYREFGRRGEEWIEWSDENPDMAKTLWPRVLVALRGPGANDIDRAGSLISAARSAESVEELEKWCAEIEARGY